VEDEVYKVTTDPIDPRGIEQLVQHDEDGAVVIFLGVVRNHSEGKRVRYLEYEAYPPMAEKKLEEIGRELKARWGVDHVTVVHRVGHLDIGEISLAIAIASAHRQEAFEAVQYAVDRIKEVVPIWKKEIWDGGAAWVGAHH
jgi:molybdopterin synthase catalytic subunit